MVNELPDGLNKTMVIKRKGLVRDIIINHIDEITTREF